MRDRKPVLAAVTMALAACAVPVGGMALAGIAPWDVGQEADDGRHEATEQHITTIADRHTPAAVFLDELADHIDDEWDVAGWVDGARAPHPLLCGAQHDPAGSFSVTVTNDDQAQVYALTYPAGLGAAELDSQLRDVRSCAASATTRSVDIGVDGHDVASLWSGTGTTTRVWRHGDVLLYVSSDSASTMGKVAGRLEEMATELLADQCLDPAAGTSDALRSPLHDDFEGWMVDHEVTIPDPERTEATQLPEPLEIVDVSLPLERPYPVWPPLPDPVDKPAEPERPQWPATATTVRITQEDPDGPGCGWAFTGQAAPVFDHDAIQVANNQTIDAARADLEAGVDAWRRELTDFWRAWPDHLAAVDDYARYGEQVAATEEAWEPIDAAWRTYRAQEQAYQADLESYRQTLEARRQLSEQYDERVAMCLEAADIVDSAQDEGQPAPDPTQEPGADLADEAGADPEETPQAAADPRLDEALTLLASCPPQRPALLDQPEPAPPVAPTPPADPRPTGR